MFLDSNGNIKVVNKMYLIENGKASDKIKFNINFMNILQLPTTSFFLALTNDTPKILYDYKISNKIVPSNVFWFVKLSVFWKCIQYTIHWDKAQMLKKFPLDKINGTKDAVFFLSRDPTHHSFIFNLPFAYELKHKICLSKTVCVIWFCFVFIKGYIFVQQKAWTLWLSIVIIPLKIRIIEKSPTVLLPDLLFLSCSQGF